MVQNPLSSMHDAVLGGNLRIRMRMLRLSDMDVGQEDLSLAFALAIIWILFLAIGCSDSACIVPIIYTVFAFVRPD
ncbi:uncharacterized protein LOC119980818 isoform X2 [Tripterygium wilfordii]|uniref:uncharacterized protein LOC119980818 isoform X2 n=1 Tax=Tripterygium wilfordii TaxID=458696 RepID=UPI0018F7F993|nr:uncharacterized protein LOC119980818 isoform X2 [Tripterygium wilfordii]